MIILKLKLIYLWVGDIMYDNIIKFISKDYFDYL